VDNSLGIIGRDILNQISIQFDGPNHRWDEVQATLSNIDIA